jgi:hypothetical protein
MPRIIVTTDPSEKTPLRTDTPVLFEEEVHSVHLSTGHAARQLVERLAWAISDAEAAESARPDRHSHPLPLGRSLNPARDTLPAAGLTVAV